jgi:hypothetical protein
MFTALFETLFAVSTIYCDCTALVEWGTNLTSNVGLSKFSPLVASMICFPPYIKGIIVGLIVSDAWFSFSKSSKKARLGFKQSLEHFPSNIILYNIQ